MLNPPSRWRWFKADPEPKEGDPAPTPKGGGKPDSEMPSEHKAFVTDVAAKLERRIKALETGEKGDGKITGWSAQVVVALILGGFSAIVLCFVFLAFLTTRKPPALSSVKPQ
jgi:hypothetical protein